MSLEEMEFVLLCAGSRGRLRSQDDGVLIISASSDWEIQAAVEKTIARYHPLTTTVAALKLSRHHYLSLAWLNTDDFNRNIVNRDP